MAMELNDGCDFMFPESFEEELTGCSGEAAAPVSPETGAFRTKSCSKTSEQEFVQSFCASFDMLDEDTCEKLDGRKLEIHDPVSVSLDGLPTIEALREASAGAASASSAGAALTADERADAHGTSGGSDADIVEVDGSGSEPVKSRRGRKPHNISVEERAQRTRDRNREHAKSARRRKKMYQALLQGQMSQTDAANASRQLDATPVDDKTNHSEFDREAALKKAVVLRFLAQRVSGVEERARWKDVAADSVVLTLPFEPFRGASPSSRTNDGTCDVLVGMEAIMEDARQLATFLAAAAHAHAHTLRSRSGGVALTGPTFEYAIDVQDMLLSGDKLMSPWRLVSHGLGDEGEVSVHGLLKCVFNSRTKIVAMELAYDGAALPLQLKSRLGLAVPARKRAPAPAAAVPSEDDASSGGQPYTGAGHKRREPPPVVEGDSVSDEGETSSDAAASSLEESALLPMNPPKAKPAKSSAGALKKSRADKPDADASSLSVNAPMLMAMQSFPGMQGMQGFPGMLPVPLMAMMPGFDPAEFLASAMNHAQQASSKEENGDES